MEKIIGVTDHARQPQIRNNELSTYYLRVIDANGRSFYTHVIIADDDIDAIENAYLICGAHRGELWNRSRLVHIIERLEFEPSSMGRREKSN